MKRIEWWFLIYPVFSLMSSISIVSLNARGLSQSQKFERLMCLTKRSDVLCLQETRWEDKISDEIRKLWNGEMYSNCDIGRKRGVAILIKKGVFEKVDVDYKDTNGRIIIVKLLCNGKEMKVCNIHAPNEEREKYNFYKDLNELIEKQENIIVLGDFNTVMQRIDIDDSMQFRRDRGRNELYNIMEKNNMVDVWREMNGMKREYSRRQIVDKILKQSRIDLFLCKKEEVHYVTKASYKNYSESDHDFLWISMNLNETDKGPGVWILNTELLKLELYKMEIESIIINSVNDEMYEMEKGFWWDSLKSRLKKFSMEYSKKIQKAKRMKEMKIKKEWDEEMRKVNVNDIDKIIELQEELRKIEEEKCKGAIIRSRAKDIVEGERSTKYFYELEKTRQRADIITSIKIQDGKSVEDKAGILGEIKRFYKDLFTENEVVLEDEEFLLRKIKVKVNEEDKEMCESGITELEIGTAIDQLKNGKCPGIDGLPAEFYKVFKAVLCPILNELYTDIFRKGNLTNSMKKGMVKIIYKRKGDKGDLKNYRPLSMLNTDYKILAKVLANRLKIVVPNIITTNQAYAVLKRDITDVINNIRDIIWYMKEEKETGYIISVDLEKAFDRVEHKYLIDVMERFGFGENFLNWIKCLYTDITSCVKVNGFLTEDFKITRSIRQGCPMSALLYTIVSEALGLAIDQEKNIKGIWIKETESEHKVFQYADDTTLILKDIKSIDLAMNILERYCKGTGAKVNKEKTTYMRVGLTKDVSNKMQFKEEKRNMKILGIRVGENENEIRDAVWEEVLKGMEKRLNFWKLRNLFLKGKVLVINSLFLSKMWYVLSSVSLPMWIYKKIKSIVLNFLWEGKTPKIAYGTLIGKVEEGGLGLIDPFIRMKSIRIKIVNKYWKDGKYAWKGVMKYFLDKCGKMGEDVLWMKLKENMMNGIPEFYKEVVKAWGEFRKYVVCMSLSKEEILRQPLFLNNTIKRGHQAIFYKKWFDAGIKQIKDIMYEVIPGFVPVQVIRDAIVENYDDESKTVLENQFKKLKEVIPKEWINILEDKTQTNCKDGMVVAYKINDKQYDFKDGILKMFYSCLCKDVFITPKAGEYWQRIFPSVEKNNIWQNLRAWWKSPILENFDYILRHNCLLSEMRLCKIGLASNAICKVCNREDEGVLHLFFKCTELQCFIKKLKQMANKLGVEQRCINEEWETIFLFGFKGNVKNECFLNFMLTIARFVIWSRRNMVKKKKTKIPVCRLFKIKMCFILNVLFDYYNMNDEKDVFVRNFVKENPLLEMTYFHFNVLLPKCDIDCS